jgi:hypothetical protein
MRETAIRLTEKLTIERKLRLNNLLYPEGFISSLLGERDAGLDEKVGDVED